MHFYAVQNQRINLTDIFICQMVTKMDEFVYASDLYKMARHLNCKKETHLKY